SPSSGAPPPARAHRSRPTRKRDPLESARAHALARRQCFPGDLLESHEAHAIRDPELQLTLEEREQRRGLHLGVNRVHFGAPHEVTIEFEKGGFVPEARRIEGLVPRGEGCRNLEGTEYVATGFRKERPAAARVRGIEQIVPVLHQERERRRVPAWCR